MVAEGDAGKALTIDYKKDFAALEAQKLLAAKNTAYMLTLSDLQAIQSQQVVEETGT
jgi:phosphoribosylcarboxyaminoimidazole (NCAIR) mutase